jgi:hypothetical protein
VQGRKPAGGRGSGGRAAVVMSSSIMERGTEGYANSVCVGVGVDRDPITPPFRIQFLVSTRARDSVGVGRQEGGITVLAVEMS